MFCFIIKMPLFIFVFSQSSNILDLKEYKWHVYNLNDITFIRCQIYDFSATAINKKKITKNLVFKT